MITLEYFGDLIKGKKPLDCVDNGVENLQRLKELNSKLLLEVLS